MVTTNGRFKVSFVAASTLALILAVSARAQQLTDYIPEPTVGSRYVYRVELAAPGTALVTGQAVVLTDSEQVIAGNTYFRIATTYRNIPGIMPTVEYSRLGQEGLYEIFPPASLRCAARRHR
jgi:hypothetical protein